MSATHRGYTMKLSVTVDVVPLTIFDGALRVMLVSLVGRQNTGSVGGACERDMRWSLPGGQLGAFAKGRAEECGLTHSAAAWLEQQSAINDCYLEQLYTFDEFDSNDVCTIRVTYLALVTMDRCHQTVADTGWFPLSALPPLPPPHEEIVITAHSRLAAKANYSTILHQLMPARFTLSELQSVYEIVIEQPLDKRNFRKRMLAQGELVESSETRREGQHRPARLYQTRRPERVIITR